MNGAPITFAILAGGAATRLGGRDKGLELLGDRPLIGWVLDALQAMDVEGVGSRPPDVDAADPLDRSRPGPRAQPTAPTTCVSAPVLIVANRHLDDYGRYAQTVPDGAQGFHGPLAGIATALEMCTTPWLVTVPVDCPEPPHDLALRLWQATLENDASAIVAHDGERRQPLFAIYRRELAASAAAAVEAEQGVSHWQSSIGAHELDFTDHWRQFENLNTPEEFAAYAVRNEP
ncbi:MAG: molybdenum cofactor guanylyltransferase [Dokdonella sp.]